MVWLLRIGNGIAGELAWLACTCWGNLKLLERINAIKLWTLFYAPLFFALPTKTTLFVEFGETEVTYLGTREVAPGAFQTASVGEGGWMKFVLYFNYILRILMRHFICCSFGMCPHPASASCPTYDLPDAVLSSMLIARSSRVPTQLLVCSMDVNFVYACN